MQILVVDYDLLVEVVGDSGHQTLVFSDRFQVCKDGKFGLIEIKQDLVKDKLLKK